MDLMPSAIQSYQKNQHLAGWVQQTETSAQVAGVKDSETAHPDDALVQISEQRQIYNWLAAEYPISSNDPATIGRASQKLYEFNIFDFQDVSRVNDLLQHDSVGELLPSIDAQLEQTDSYRQREVLTHVKQVFMTLQAAELRPVA